MEYETINCLKVPKEMTEEIVKILNSDIAYMYVTNILPFNETCFLVLYTGDYPNIIDQVNRKLNDGVQGVCRA